ncbi:MAG TPA: MarR family winged helix-turn-helix transcriptional regulator [Patescibacteria group bacterium]|nr:MarR family winged helix-turn-helix transcriptional regulator [Patescibacteria group bacterium]
MSSPYYDAINLIERLHRQFLDVLKVELERANILDINNVQSMILHNIGTDELTVGELTVRGYYLGSNVSYNVKKMVENGYLVQERSIHDKRSVRVKLSEKGRKLSDAITRLYKKHEEKLAGAGLPNARFDSLNQVLRDIETFWAEQMGSGGLNVS